jgi:hypothetical protein
MKKNMNEEEEEGTGEAWNTQNDQVRRNRGKL